jgi:hypothetical protein
MDVADTTLKEVAAVEPNLTAVAPVRFVPVTVTEVPPAVEPEGGLTEVTTGALVALAGRAPRDPNTKLKSRINPDADASGGAHVWTRNSILQNCFIGSNLDRAC